MADELSQPSPLDVVAEMYRRKSDPQTYVDIMRSLWTLPQRALEAGRQGYEEQTFNPAAMETAMTVAGGRSPFAAASTGELGSAGGALRFWSEHPDVAIKPGDLRASTRFPTAKGATEDPLKYHLSIGMPEVMSSDMLPTIASKVSGYPGFKKLQGRSPQEIVRGYVDQAQGNLSYLYEHAPDIMRQRSPLWYEGAHMFRGALAVRWGVPGNSVSAAIASLSPQRDWFMNASLAERTGDILLGPASSRIMTPEMEAFQRTAASLNTPTNALIFRRIQGRRLSDLTDPLEQAMWIRLYDEAHNPRAFRALTPEGNLGDFVTSPNTGKTNDIQWGSLDQIAGAVTALRSGGDMKILSPLLGDRHKVRSFYNNIEVPHDVRFGDVTADTHQVAAAQLRPLSSASPEVEQNLAGPPHSSITGVRGTYGLTAEATRGAAKEYGLLPRAAQSATWEPVRELFQRNWKTAKNVSAVDDIWRAHDRGELSLDQARRAIFDLAGGIGPPSWAKSGSVLYDPYRASTYRGNVSGNQLVGATPGTVRAGGAGDYQPVVPAPLAPESPLRLGP